MDCYVIAGGASKRFGSAKSEALWEGIPFLQRVASAATAVFSSVWFVAKGPLPSIPEARIVLDEPGDGSAAIFGIRRALKHTEQERVWLLAVDYPLVTSEALEYVVEVFERGGETMAVPVWDGHPQMLCAGYSKELVGLLDEQISRGALKLRDLLDKTDARLIEEEDLRAVLRGEPFSNINDKAALDAARRKYGRT